MRAEGGVGQEEGRGGQVRNTPQKRHHPGHPVLGMFQSEYHDPNSSGQASQGSPENT